ncbi:MAG: hypothetical protein ABI281_12895 [Caldimonas sp.]
MHRYYMNAETRDALIAESKRMIAEARAQRATPRLDAAPATDSVWSHTLPLVDEDVPEEAVEEGSAFASLVSELWSASTSAPRVPSWRSGLSR